MSKEVSSFFKELRACEDGLNWVSGKSSLKEAWETCDRVDWMLWALGEVGVKNDRALQLFACACVRGTPLGDGRVVWDILDDPRSRQAVEVAERFADQKEAYATLAAAQAAARAAAKAAAWNATRAAAQVAELAAEADAAWAAAWAATRADAWAATAAAARAAAWVATEAATQKWQADLLRHYITWTEVEAAIKKI